MADRFESCSNTLKEFNKNYGLDFSLDTFDLKAQSLGNFGPDSALNGFYKSTFAELYGKVFGNCVDGFIDSQKANPAKFFSDFEKVMIDYRKVCRDEERPYPAPNGGWTNPTEPMEYASQAIAGVPTDKIEYATQRYESGKLRIRDMRKYADTVNNTYSYIPKEDRMRLMSTVHCYTEALKKANESRSFLGKVFNLSRHLAERRAIETFEIYTNSIAKFEAGDGSANEKLAEMKVFAKSDDVEKMRNAVVDFVDRAKLRNASGATEEKVKMSIHEAAQESRVKNAEKIEQTKAQTLGKSSF